MDMSDPHIGMVSFQKALDNRELSLGPVRNHQDLYSHIDQPAPDTIRLTYVRLNPDRSTVQSFVSCVMNGYVKGFPCVSVGYAVPEALRNQGHAKQILADVVKDQVYQAGQNGIRELYVEAIIDIRNIASQRVADSILTGSRDHLNEEASGRPAVRFTARFDTATGKQLPIS
ncbi:GNAT family N-acetyltransferase [Pseudomonas sp. URMO17WK12:I11]|uniref:GNAT family N-acetyltransferase n=1 Tax=Pseudomonas sp. URMO17WK12:I11 TaxID=1283291 RepID=UPI00119CA165|nr:GNAT family protein [Pseudomonas sp. URMO17WK12:I11]